MGIGARQNKAGCWTQPNEMCIWPFASWASALTLTLVLHRFSAAFKQIKNGYELYDLII